MVEARVIAEGVLEGLRAHLAAAANGPATVAQYELTIGNQPVALNRLIGQWLRIEVADRMTCANCGAVIKRRFGDGYCYPCFSTLARCDLCVVSPDRCHYAQGTCREPTWGETYCMRPHVVYLANSGGAKVGITHPGNVPGRWLDQGAAAAVIVLEVPTRHAAGCAEKIIGRHLRESTDWRMLVSAPPAHIDLIELWRQLRPRTQAEFDTLGLRFPLQFVAALQERSFSYPIEAFAPAVQLKLDAPSDVVAGRLTGVVGSYMLFDRGVFNVRAHTSNQICLMCTAPQGAPPGSDQLELF
jgi:hypothetical protein